MSLIGSNKRLSIRRLALASDMKKSSVHRILRKDLSLKPYKPQTSQELKEGDKTKRLEFCLKIEEMIQNDEFYTWNIIFSDESHVYLKSSPNKQNNRGWCLSRAANRTSVPLHSSEVTARCGVTSDWYLDWRIGFTKFEYYLVKLLESIDRMSYDMSLQNE